MAKSGTGVRVKVFDGSGKKLLGLGYLVGLVDVWVISMPDGLIKSLKIAERRPSKRTFKRSGGISLRKISKNPKIRLDNGSIVYGCQVWWIDVKAKSGSRKQPVHKLACLDSKTKCEPNKKPAGFCTGCGG